MAHKPKIDNSVNKHDRIPLNCNWTGTADFGRIVPFHWEELVQGDHVITCQPRIEMQLLPLASPTFGKIDLYCHYFVVPLRQLQDHFYDIWSQTGVYKNAKLPFTVPHELSYAFDAYSSQGGDSEKYRSIFKHWTSLGLSPFFITSSSDHDTPISLFPFFAYNKIWWDFYRDPEVLRDESKSDYLVSDIDGKKVFNSVQIAATFVEKYMHPHVRSIKSNWISNLFTSPGNFLDNLPLQEGYLQFDSAVYNDKVYIEPQSGETLAFGNNPDGFPAPVDNTSRMLRLTEALTRLSERLSLSGKREIEALFARYNVKPNWSKMNLCRYVGGAKSTVLVENIISTADTSGDSGLPLGAQGGKGYCALDNLNIEVSVDEPSILMGVVSVMPHIHFVQGLSRKWQRATLQDIFQPSLQYVGQVAVAKREIGKQFFPVQYDESKDAETFAFADPYYEYKMGLDILAGDFMYYHNRADGVPAETSKYMQSMEQYIDYPEDRQFNLNNLLVDGQQYNKIFSYLGGSVDEDVDDHFQLCIDKEVLIDRPMEGYPVPTLETTQDPHVKKTALSQDVVF